jgi:hypothetical protein
MQEGPICPEILVQQPVEFPTAVTRKLLTIWSHFMYHRKAERVGYHNIQNFRSYGQSEAQKLSLFSRCSVQKQNSVVTSIVKIP